MPSKKPPQKQSIKQKQKTTVIVHIGDKISGKKKKKQPLKRRQKKPVQPGEQSQGIVVPVGRIPPIFYQPAESLQAYKQPVAMQAMHTPLHTAVSSTLPNRISVGTEPIPTLFSKEQEVESPFPQNGNFTSSSYGVAGSDSSMLAEAPVSFSKSIVESFITPLSKKMTNEYDSEMDWNETDPFFPESPPESSPVRSVTQTISSTKSKGRPRKIYTAAQEELRREELNRKARERRSRKKFMKKKMESEMESDL